MMPRPGYFSDRPFTLSTNFLMGSTRGFNLGGGLGLSYCYPLAPVACLDLGGGVDYTEGFGPYQKPDNASQSFYERGVHPYTQIGLSIYPSHHWGVGLFTGYGYSHFWGKPTGAIGAGIPQQDYSSGGFMFRGALSFILRINQWAGFHFDAGFKTLPAIDGKEDRHWGFEGQAGFQAKF